MKHLLKPLTWSLFTLVSAFVLSCASNDEPDPVDCSVTDLSLTLDDSVDPTSCESGDGSITVAATGGKSPYTYKLNSGSFGSSSSFSNLDPGSYTVTVRDANNCEKKLAAITLTAPSAPVAGVSTVIDQTNCTSPNGSITANVTGGTPPYMYKLGTGSFIFTATFGNLRAGNYTITVQDDSDCTITINETVDSNTGVSYATDIFPILQANCIKSGCHNGDNGADRNWSVFLNVQAKAAGIKTRTGNGSMPADISPLGLPQSQRDLIACWVDEGAKNN
jgi:uncharacterized protein (DUF2141 family)